MVLSMTGYGRAEQVLNGRDIVVELRSVNSRFFEYSSRVPRTCSFLEDKLKKLVAAKVSRGKVELNLSIQNVAAADTVVQVNWQLAKSYQTAMQAMSEKLDLKKRCHRQHHLPFSRCVDPDRCARRPGYPMG